MTGISVPLVLENDDRLIAFVDCRIFLKIFSHYWRRNNTYSIFALSFNGEGKSLEKLNNSAHTERWVSG